ncbi:unnamed protein product [Effrenium voratum]|nr:unnamed protein product [Effrenium voratum]
MAQPSTGNCEQDFWNAHIFFKAHSAAIWSNGGWKVLQQEGFHSACLDGGGHFYFALLASNMLSSDLGVCVPSSCNENDITWKVFPLIFRHFFDTGAQQGLQFGVRLHQYHQLGFEDLRAPEIWQLGLAVGLLLCLLGVSEGQKASGPGAQICLLVAVCAGEVMLYTRWQMYDWHSQHLPMFALARSVGELALQAQLALQLLRLASCRSLGQACQAAALRVLQLAFAFAACCLATRQAARLTVNVFSQGAWYQTWSRCFHEVEEPWLEILLHGRDCRHLQRLRSELQVLFCSLPLLLLASLSKKAAAVAVAAACCAWLNGVPELTFAQIATSAALLNARCASASRKCGAGVALMALAATGYSDLDAQRMRLARAAIWPWLLCLGDVSDFSLGADLAIPMLPLALFVLEGYVEPHSKDLTGCDFLARLLGLTLAALFCGQVLSRLPSGLQRLARLLSAEARVASLEAQLEAERQMRLSGRKRGPSLLLAIGQAGQQISTMALPGSPIGVLTLGALACSLTAMRVAFSQQWAAAAGLIMAAAVCDGLDGHVARLLDAVTVFGGELDSLGDLVNFGVAPAIVIYAWADEKAGDFWDVVLWISCVFFCQACALRLARFNCSPGGPAFQGAPPENQKTEKSGDSSGVPSGPNAALIERGSKFLARSKFFTGVPAPMGAMLALLPLFWHLDARPLPFGCHPRQVASVVLLLSGLLMVSHLKTLSSKMFVRDPKKASHLRITSPWEGMLKLLGISGAVCASLCSPWRLVLAMELIYVVSLFVGPVVYLLLAD